MKKIAAPIVKSLLSSLGYELMAKKTVANYYLQIPVEATAVERNLISEASKFSMNLSLIRSPDALLTLRNPG